MAEIYISHRRDDSRYRARLICDALTKVLCAAARPGWRDLLEDRR